MLGDNFSQIKKTIWRKHVPSLFQQKIITTMIKNSAIRLNEMKYFVSEA